MSDGKTYVALIGLGRKKPLKTIKKGEVVPDDYPRLEEAIRRGWVVEQSAAPVIPSGPESGDEVLPTGVDSLEGITFDSDIADLDFVTDSIAQKLADEGFILIRDLADHTKDELTVIEGIGNVKATELLNAYDAIVKRK